MSKVTFNYGTTGLTNIYIVFTAEAGTIWNGSALEAILAANWATYDIAMTEASTTGIYQATIPALPAGVYGVTAYLQAGGSPATTDTPLGSSQLVWDGSAEVRQTGDAFARLGAPANGSIAADIATRQTLGAGSVAEIFTINDGVNPLDGVDVWVTTDLAGTDVVARGYTNISGQVTLMLDPGSYYAWKQLSGYTFTNPEAFTVV